MNGVHDLGGMHGMGPINPEKDEPVFHSEWERRAFGVMMATFAGGHYNVDEFRHGIERMDPAEYLRSSYYEHWLHTVESTLIEKGAITREELERKWAELGKGAQR
jgi:nitrile hydratase